MLIFLQDGQAANPSGTVVTEKQQILEHNLQDIRKRVQVRFHLLILLYEALLFWRNHCLNQRHHLFCSGYGTKDENAWKPAGWLWFQLQDIEKPRRYIVTSVFWIRSEGQNVTTSIRKCNYLYLHIHFVSRAVPGPQWQQPGICNQAEDGSAWANAECPRPAQEGTCQYCVTLHFASGDKSGRGIMYFNSQNFGHMFGTVVHYWQSLKRHKWLFLWLIFSVLAANCYRNGRFADCHGLCTEELDKRRTSRLEEAATNCLYRRST